MIIYINNIETCYLFSLLNYLIKFNKNFNICIIIIVAYNSKVYNLQYKIENTYNSIIKNISNYLKDNYIFIKTCHCKIYFCLFLEHILFSISF